MLRLAFARRAAAPVALLFAALLAGCGGGGGGGTTPPPTGGDAALSASKPGEVLAHVKRLVRERATQRARNEFVADMPMLAPALAVAGGAQAAGTQVIRSDTLVQEAGVGEHDLIKSDGQWIYTLDTATTGAGGQVVPRLSAWQRRADGTLATPQRRPLPEAEDRSAVIHGLQHAPSAQRLAVLGETIGYLPPVDFCLGTAPCITPLAMPYRMMGRSETTLQLLDLAGGGIGGTLTRVALDGRLLSSRLLGSMLVLVSTHAPQLPVDALPAGTGEAEREAALAALTNADVLPTVRIDGGPSRPLVADTDCYLQPANGSDALEITTLTLIDLSQPGAVLKSRCFVGGSEALYMATDALYLATTRYAYTRMDTGGGGVVALSYPPQISTDIHKFGFDGSQLRYRASGSVAGHLGWDGARKSYRLSEHEGLLRVLSFTGEFGWARAEDASTRPPSPATLTVLREDTAGGRLAVVSTLPNGSRPQPLGHAGEQVHGVRFIGTRGYLVTFLRTDPLWVLDLADPADPKVAGELQVPGFSDQLVPLDRGMLLGVGRDADARGVVTGLKVSLFDVADPARPTERATLTFGGPGSMSALDTSPHGLNILGVDHLVRAALPVLLTSPTPPSGDPWQHGLQRFEIDLAAGTIATRPMVAPPKPADAYAVWDERSIQIGEHVYYLAGGELLAQPW